MSLADNTDFELGSGDFTLEAYVYQSNAAGTGSNSHAIINKWNNSGTSKSYALRITSSSGQKYQFIWSTDGSANNSITSTDLISVNRWHHVAVVNDGGTITLYINGKSQSSTGTAGTLYDSSVELKIGRTDADSGSQYFDGYIQDVRVYKGAAKYTSDFVVPSTSPDIIPDTPSGVSGSSKLTKITDGAVSFDGPTNGASVGTGYLTIPSSNSSDFNFGTGDFTWEAFVYCDDWTGGSSNQDQFVIHHEPTAGGDGSGLFVSGGQSYYYSNKDSSRNIITGPVLGDRRWYHIAASRESGTLRLFVDGVSVGSASYTDSYADAIFTLGRNENNNKNQFRGFISNFRVIKGTALYTSRFTPPTAPLTNVTNTKLLCCQSPTSATEVLL